MEHNKQGIDTEAGIDVPPMIQAIEGNLNYKSRFKIPEWCSLIAKSGNVLTESLHGLARDVGHWTSLADGFPYANTHQKRDELIVQKLLLIHSEVSEACEGHRTGKMDDKLPHRTMLEAELADAAIRIFDLAGFLEIDLGAIIVEKSMFNADRPDHTLEERRKKGGKKY